MPAWFLPGGGFVVAETEGEALELARVRTGRPDLELKDLRQEEDCLDTWFSSWLWPISLFNGILEPENEEIRYYYPTTDLVTAPDIIFFWVARMIMAGYEFRGERPFRNVYFTGLVRDKQGRKMSKSLGNSPDPLDLIEAYGADGVRVGMLLCAPAGGDLLFDESLPEQGRNFTTKMWNAYRLVSGWEETTATGGEQPEAARRALEWFEGYLQRCKRSLEVQFEQYRVSEALMTVYTGFRDEFSSWLLEAVKPARGERMDGRTRERVVALFEEMLQLLHPFMPFVTEEIWQGLRPRREGESIMVSRLPEVGTWDEGRLAEFERVKEVVAGIRTVRKQHNVAFREEVALKVKRNERYPAYFESVIRKMGNVSCVEVVEESVAGAWSFMVDTVEYFVPATGEVDREATRAKLEADLKYAEGFLASVMKKLGNEKFVNGAPAKVVENERKKQADAERQIAALREQLAGLQ